MTNITFRAEIDLTGFDVSDDPARQGNIEIRWRLLMLVDGVAQDNVKLHRDLISSEVDLEARFILQRAHLAERGYNWDSYDMDLALLQGITNLIWTPTVKQARLAFIEAEVARLNREAAEAEQRRLDRLNRASQQKED
jgi:hypothetical protein